MTSPVLRFFIGGSVLCATNTVVGFLGHEKLYSFCSDEYDNFQKNSNFFGAEISKSAMKVGETKIYKFLEQLINYVSLIIPINCNKTTTFASLISRLLG